MTPYCIWINRQQLELQIDQDDISFSFREYIVFKIRQTSNPESDEEDDQYNDDVMQSDERLPPIRLDFLFQRDNGTVRLSCDRKYQVYWQDIDSTESEKPLWSEGENSLELEWDKDYQFNVLDGSDFVSMLLMVTKRPSTPVTTFSVGRDTPSPKRTHKPPVVQLLHILQSTFNPKAVHEP
jgi:hypothetical protein